MIAVRTSPSPLRTAALLLVLLSIAGCGGSARPAGPQDYPIVEPSPPERQQPVTTPDGAVVTLPALPTVHETNPSPTCERTLATFHDGSRPTRRPIVIPPAPGLRAVAVTERTTRVEWSFRDLPADCRPVMILVSVRNGTDPGATPTTERLQLHEVSGSAEIAYPEFLPPPDVAIASALSRQGHHSRTVSVLIRRPANVPPDPPEPAPPVTAPAGRPIECTGPATVVDDPAGDVLTYEPGSPPAQVTRLTPELSRIDITRAAAQIDGRTICATFSFDRRPADADFQLTFTLRDTSTSSCCSSLRFRRTRGRLEVGHFVIGADGASELHPVRGAGAALRGKRLVLTGTLPPPSAWQGRMHRMPSAANVGWSATTGYFPEKYGPYFGDWLPRYSAAGEPIIRHRDGATVTPGRIR